ncbi:MULTISPECIES: DUF3987 domain-containing protein [Streptomyces]|uniref:DUF3987 domain-containing protein n=1 Tax=Streptomyces TaxID=1883 RepID=UPI001E3C7821|nr:MULTISPECIES: DUF3987 domain-containing protein [Streptomyces]UFQ16433.1 DUF3987 domain-containing protein [Streptomyces huasconensis]WCL86035.1 DUF3987 domain-containing protein [Streptomyces sp. JCM 35825]
MFESMKYGPIGEAVEKVMPVTEADPVGIYAATLSLFSAAINGHVTTEDGRPIAVWTVLAGRSGIGCKGTAYRNARALMGPPFDGFFSTRIVSGVSSGPSLVSNLYGIELASMGSEDGPDSRALIIEEEWAEILKRAKRCPTFDQKLRTAWDGGEIQNRTKGKDGTGEVQRVERPLLGFHCHITPGEWASFVSATAALGGSYNRLLPVLVEQSKMLPYGKRSGIKADLRLAEAYRWAKAKPRAIQLAKEAYGAFDEIRAVMLGKMANTPEHIGVYFERTAEQVLRVAAVLAASEMKTRISKKALQAAWAFVQYSINSVEKLVTEAHDGSQVRVKSLPDMIREVLKRHGGECTSTLLLRSLQAHTNAAGLKETVDQLDDVEYFKGKSSTSGPKPTIYRLVTEDTKAQETKDSAPERPALTLVADPKPKAAPKKTAPKKVVIPQPAAATVSANPFVALL